MRIITGIYKGRRFDIPRSFKARPTTDFAKENIFNVLKGYLEFEGCEALDLFSGTGSISLELLSRGCKMVSSVELDREHAAFIRQCVEKLGITNHLLVRGDAFKFMQKCRQKFDFIFADPPYSLDNLAEIPAQVFAHELLKDGGILVLEHGEHHDFSTNPYFFDHRTYGSVNFSLFKKSAG